MIKINNYFFEVEDIEINPNEQGNSRRAWNGYFHNNCVSKYLTVKIKITDLSLEEHLNLLFLLDTNRNYDNTNSEHLIFENLKDDDFLKGESIMVDIPVDDGYDYNRLEGDEELYEWDLTLEQVDPSINYT